jgi:endonuclease YncB( thermonuclease family)
MTMPIRARIALALALSMASPAVTEMSAGRASVVDGDTLEVRAEGMRLDGVDAPESGQLCDDVNDRNHRCGVGTEWAVTDRVSIKSEAVYLRLEDDSFRRTSAVSSSGDTKRIDHEDSVWIGRIGVNFRLEGGAPLAD